MTYTTLDTYNLSNGAQILLCYVNDITVYVFGYMLLTALFIIVGVGAYMMQKRTSGYGDFPSCFTTASIVTLTFAVMLKLIDCPYNSLVNGWSMIILIGLTIGSFIYLFSSHD